MAVEVTQIVAATLNGIKLLRLLWVAYNNGHRPDSGQALAFARTLNKGMHQ